MWMRPELNDVEKGMDYQCPHFEAVQSAFYIHDKFHTKQQILNNIIVK